MAKSTKSMILGYHGRIWDSGKIAYFDMSLTYSVIFSNHKTCFDGK